MYIIVIGCGKVGKGFAEVLCREGHDVAIVDNDAAAFERLADDFTGLRVVGVPIDQDVLKKAGIEQADAVAAVTPNDNVNIMVCQIAKELYQVPKVIARIYNPSREQVFHQFGLDTICPTNLTVDVIRSIILNENVLSKYVVGSNALTFREEVAEKRHVGSRVRDLILCENEFLFGLIRKSDFQFAYPDVVLEAHDTLILATKVD